MALLHSLRGKIYLAFAGLSLLLGLALLLFLKFEYAGQLRIELEKRGISIARHLARQSVAPILSRDPLTIKLAALQAQKTEDDIVYVFFRDPHSGAVFAHTFGDDFPVDLLDLPPLTLYEDHRVSHLDTDAGSIYDVVVPVGQGGLGQVHVGISAQPVTAAVNALTRDILLATLLLAGASLLVSLPLSAALVRPLGQLTHAVREIAAGRFGHRISERGKDEIGELARSFNTMTGQLQSAQQELIDRNRLLAEEVERRQAAETSLASQLKFLATLMNELPEPVFYKSLQGIFLGCNRAFEDFYGRPRTQIVGRSTFDIYPEAEARLHDQVDRELFEHPGSCQYEHTVTVTGAQQRQAIFKKTTFVDSAGEIGGLVGVIIDVTAERRIDQMRQDFVSTTAHEFQTPLTAIMGFCEILQQQPENPAINRAECLSIIQERAEFLSRLVDQFLDLSRIEAGRDLPLNLAPCHPQRLIEKVLRNLRDQRHRFQIRFAEDCPPVLADEDRICQVLDNLIGNAIKYSPPAGPITISGQLEGPLLRIVVSDLGPGLPEEARERIFEKFFRVDNSETAPAGTGLGLYITRGIVEAHGGTIGVLSPPGQGATFVFTLPVVAQAPTGSDS